MEELLDPCEGMMVPAGSVIQEDEDDLWQQVEGSGPQQNLMSFVALSKLAGQGMRGISVSLWSGGTLAK